MKAIGAVLIGPALLLLRTSPGSIVSDAVAAAMFIGIILAFFAAPQRTR